MDQHPCIRRFGRLVVLGWSCKLVEGPSPLRHCSSGLAVFRPVHEQGFILEPSGRCFRKIWGGNVRKRSMPYISRMLRRAAISSLSSSSFIPSCSKTNQKFAENRSSTPEVHLNSIKTPLFPFQFPPPVLILLSCYQVLDMVFDPRTNTKG